MKIKIAANIINQRNSMWFIGQIDGNEKIKALSNFSIYRELIEDCKLIERNNNKK